MYTLTLVKSISICFLFRGRLQFSGDPIVNFQHDILVITFVDAEGVTDCLECAVLVDVRFLSLDTMSPDNRHVLINTQLTYGRDTQVSQDVCLYREDSSAIQLSTGSRGIGSGASG